MNILEKLFGANFAGPPSAKYDSAICGHGTVNSGSTVRSIACTTAKSGSIIILTEMLSGSAGVAVNSGGPLAITAINNDVGFVVGNATGVGVPWDRKFSWFIIRTN